MTATLRRAFLVSALALGCAATAQAQSVWPHARPIRLIVPFTAGGSTDGIARLVAQKLGERLGQSVIVDNVGGGGGTIGTYRAAQAEPDGYTLLLGVDSPAAIAQYVNPQSVKYDTARDLVAIGLIATQPMIVMGRPGLPADSFAKVLEMARAQPDTLTYATSGIGTVLHLAMEIIQQQAQVRLRHVPYRGGAQATTDLLGNQVDLAILASGSAVPLVTAGKVKGLAVTTAQRLPTLPDVPAIGELPALKGMAMTAWIGLFAPARTPANIVARLNQDLNQVLQQPEVKAKFAEQSVVPGTGNAAQFGDFVKKEQARYQRIVKDANIKE